MLTKGEYRDNSGRVVNIGGRIREYSDKQPFVWSLQGNWYHEETGQFVDSRRTSKQSEALKLERFLHTVGAKRSIYVPPPEGEEHEQDDLPETAENDRSPAGSGQSIA